MKRKIFSKLLMGAFLIASVSSFVSCKDYDDDINNLQKQIDAAALKAELTTLQTNLQAQIQEAKSAAQAAQAAAEAAQKTADNAATKDALEAVKTAANNAGTAAAQAIADAANAQVAANAAQTTANNAGSAAEKAAADAAKAIADAAAAQSTAGVAQAAAAAAAEAAKVAQTAADGASTNATKALADAASALSGAAAAQEAAKAAQATAGDAAAAATAGEAAAAKAQATADNAVAAAGNAAAQAAEALTAANAAKVAAEAAKYNDEAVKLLIDNAQKSADAAAKDAKDAADAAAAAVAASIAAGTEAAAATEAAAKIDEAVAAATKAINDATDAKIKAAVAEVVAKIPADQSATVAEQGTAIADLASKLEALGTAEGGVATKEALAAVVEDLQGKIEAATVSAETIAEVAAAAGTIQDALNEFLTTITSVELFRWNGDLLNRLDHKNLEFFWAEEVATWKFGMDLKAGDAGVALTNTQMTDHTVDFTENLVNISKDSVVIRVVPIKAELTADMICLLNTQGDTISSDFIKVGKPYRLTEKLYTRATTDIEVGGLWVVPFEVNKDKFTAEIAASKAKITDWKKQKPVAESFNKEWSDSKDGSYNSNKKYLYAVAVKTHQGEAEADSRRIITQHDLTLQPVMAEHAPDYFEVTTLEATKVNGKTVIGEKSVGISDIHNRFTLTEEEKTYTTKVPEYNYMNLPTGTAEKYYNYPNWYRAYAPAHFAKGTNISSREGKGVINGASDDDNRQADNLVILDLDIDNQIAIDFSAARTGFAGLSSATWGSEQRIKAFYVTLDADFALESKASELQAWSTYEYTNTADEKTVAIYDVANRPIAMSGKMFDGETGIIVFNVPEEKKEALRGEIIGFRVFAVNYDGTVVNPDGRAFYVQIKKADTPAITADEVNVTITATKEKGDVSGFVEIPAAFRNKYAKGGHFGYNSEVVSTTPYFANGTDMYREQTTSTKGSNTTTTVKEDYNGAWSVVDAHEQPITDPFQVAFYKDGANNSKVLTDLDDPDVKYVKVTINAEELVDNEIYKMAYDVYDTPNVYWTAADRVARLQVNVKKVIPEGADALPAWFGVKPESVHDGKVRICLVPSLTNGFNADADQKHTNYGLAGDFTDYNSTAVANAAWYQVFEVLKGAKDAPEDVILSFNGSDAFDTKATTPTNCKTDNYLDADNDGVGVSTYYYNTTKASWMDANKVWTAADEWSQWGTTENLYVFSNPKTSIANAEKETDAAKKKIAYQNIRNSWPAVKDVTVGAYYDNAKGPKISRTIENKTISGSTTKQVDEKLYTEAHSVKADVANWMTFTFACWHHSANFDLSNIATYDEVFSDMTLMYGLKSTTKKISLSVKYGDELSEYVYYDGTEATPSATKIAMNGSIKIKDILSKVQYTNPYLTTNTGYSVDNMTRATLDNTIASQACIKKVSPDVNGNVYPRVVPSKGYTGTDKQLETLTYYKYDTANDKLVKRDNTAAFVTPLYEYIQYHYVDFFGHDVLVEVPFYIHN